MTLQTGNGLFWCICKHLSGSAAVSPAPKAAKTAALPGMKNSCSENSPLPTDARRDGIFHLAWPGDLLRHEEKHLNDLANTAGWGGQ